MGRKFASRARKEDHDLILRICDGPIFPACLIEETRDQLQNPNAYLISAGPRQLCVWGSRVRPRPQPPTRSLAEMSGNRGLGAMPAVEISSFGNGDLV